MQVPYTLEKLLSKTLSHVSIQGPLPPISFKPNQGDFNNCYRILIRPSNIQQILLVFAWVTYTLLNLHHSSEKSTRIICSVLGCLSGICEH
jgi:hypothetical protein